MENEVVPHETHLDGHQYGPPNLNALNWRHLFSSSWKDTNHRRIAMASFVQSVYRLELDRQENRTQENALAPSWWIAFNYKLTKVLIDERDGSIFGAIFEWDRSAALAGSLPIRPSGAPKAVIALRGTLLKSPTRRRDIEDDLRFAAWESLKGSVRYKVTLEAIKSVSDTYGSRNVCLAGHSLGAGFGLQVGKELAKEGINVETHLFNPPSVSLAMMSLGNIGEKAQYVRNVLKFMLSSGSEAQVSNDGDKTHGIKLKRFISQLSGLMDAAFGAENWVPHLYVNSNDYISCFYSYTGETGENVTDKENMSPTNRQNKAKLFVGFKENQKFLEAHGLKQWLSSDVELRQDIHNSKFITIRSLNIATPSLVILLLYPHIVSFASSHINIREMTDYIWNILKSVPLSQVVKLKSAIMETVLSGVGVKGWIPQLSGLNNASYWVWKCVGVKGWIPRLSGLNNASYWVWKCVGVKGWIPQLSGLNNASYWVWKCVGVKGWIPRLFGLNNVSYWVWKCVGVKGWIPRLSDLNNASYWVWKCVGVKGWIPQLSGLNNACYWVWKSVGVKDWIPQLSGLNNASYWVWKCVHYLYVYKSDGTGERMLDRENVVPTNGQRTANLSVVTKEKLKFLAAHGLEQWWPSDAELQQVIHNSRHIRRHFGYSYTTIPWEVTYLFKPSVSLAMILSNIGQKEEFVWKWNSLKAMLPSSSEAQLNKDGDKTSDIGLKSWVPKFYGFKDAGFAVGKWIPPMYSNNSDYMSKQLRSLYSTSSTPSQVSHLFNLPSVLPIMSLGNPKEKAEFV